MITILRLRIFLFLFGKVRRVSEKKKKENRELHLNSTFFFSLSFFSVFFFCQLKKGGQLVVYTLLNGHFKPVLIMILQNKTLCFKMRSIARICLNNANMQPVYILPRLSRVIALHLKQVKF